MATVSSGQDIVLPLRRQYYFIYFSVYLIRISADPYT